jgi:hypothetical protein
MSYKGRTIRIVIGAMDICPTLATLFATEKEDKEQFWGQGIHGFYLV